MTACVPWDTGAADGSGTTFKAFVCLIIKFLKPIPVVLVSLSMLYFFWGIGKYIGAAGQEELQKGRNTIIYGIIAMFVMVALWGLVFILQKEFGLNLN